MILYLKKFEEDGEVDFGAFLSELDFWADCGHCVGYTTIHTCAECKYYDNELVVIELLPNKHFKICPHWRDREDVI